MPASNSTFGGPSDGRPNVAAPDTGGGTPNYGAKIDRWKDKLKAGKGNKDRLRNKIQGAKVDRWSAKTKDLQNQPPAYDSAYNAETAAANQTFGNSMIAQGLHNSQVQNEYGFDPAYASPYSRASALSSAWQQDQRTTLNSYAAGGQLYSGARENAVAHDNRAYLSDLNTAQTDWQNQLAQVAAEGTAAEEQRQADINAAQAAWEQRLQDNPAADPGPPPKFIQQEKKDLKNRIKDLKGDRKDAKNKFSRQKIQKKIKKAKSNLQSIPGKTKDV